MPPRADVVPVFVLARRFRLPAVPEDSDRGAEPTPIESGVVVAGGILLDVDDDIVNSRQIQSKGQKTEKGSCSAAEMSCLF